ncbi:MAG: hypothetical protein WC712_05780 [Candidatus Brocadiia bacterium]
MSRLFLMLLCLSVCWGLCRAEEPGAGLSLRETGVCWLDPEKTTEDSVVVSRNHRHVALIEKTIESCRVLRDGGPEQDYEKIRRPQFSPDGAKLAYIVTEKGKSAVVENRKIGKRYDEIVPESLVYSRDSSTLAYVAIDGGKQFAVVGGEEKDKYDKISELHLSGDGKRYAVLVPLPNEPGGDPLRDDAFFVDGKRVEGFKQCQRFGFSPDGSRYAFVAQIGKDGQTAANGMVLMRIVIDGTEVADTGILMAGPYEYVRFSEDGRRTAYVVGYSRFGEAYVVVDGERSGPYMFCSQPRFSPSGKTVAWISASADESVCHVNGTVWKTVTANAFGTWGSDSEFAFSATETVAFTTKEEAKGTRGHVVENDVPQKVYDFVSDLKYDAAGRLCYIAQLGKQAMLIRGGEAEKSFECERLSKKNWRLYLSDDGKLAALVLPAGGGNFVAMEGRTTDPLGKVIASQPLIEHAVIPDPNVHIMGGPMEDPLLWGKRPTLACFNPEGGLDLIVLRDGKLIHIEVREK